MSPRPLLLGHRGARDAQSIPENTLESFDLALARGCDGFEFDVRVTGDGKAVICHDPQIDGVDVAISTVDRLSGLPQLEEVLIRYQQNAFLDIELKVPGLEAISSDLLKKHAPSRGCVVSSFLPEPLCAVHVRNVALPLGLICEKNSQLDFWRALPVEYVIPHYKLVRPELIREIQQTGAKVFVWTVNNPADMRRFAHWGVDGIISDNTELLVRTLTP